MNGNVGSEVKQYCRRQLPNYASILTTVVKNKDKSLFLVSLHSFLDKNSANKREPSQRIMHHWLPPRVATNSDVLATYLHSVALAEYISLKKTTEGGRKFSFNILRSVSNYFFRTLMLEVILVH